MGGRRSYRDPAKVVNPTRVADDVAPVPEDPEVEELVVEALGEHESKGEAGLEAFYAAHPEHAGAVRERVERLRSHGFLGSVADVEGSPRKLGEVRLVERLGAGGMGVVYRAVQESLGREVALKPIRPEDLYFPGARDRFRREVEIIARLQHPGIVPIHTVGEEGGIPYFAMQLLQGATIDAKIRKLAGREPSTLTGRDLAPDPENPGYLFAGTWEEACLRVIRQVADALHHAHERGVVHRDIKPSNVFLTSDGVSRAVLLDFGLAVTSAAASKLTRTGSRLGSLHYMSPEQVRGGAAVSRATDVYSLGVTLYEMLTLRAPFE